jgi:molecular chaperone DnaJ
MLRIRDEGVPVSGRRGNLYIRLMIQIPAKLSRRGRELMEELSRVEGENSSPRPISLSELSEQ